MDNRNFEQKDNHEEYKENKNTGHMKHGLLMMLGCLVPILVIVGLPLLGINAGRLGSLVFLLCPLLHIGMMAFMMKSGGGKSCHEGSKPAQSSQE